MTAVSDVLAFLDSGGVVGGASGWQALPRRFVDDEVTHQLVVVTEDGGEPPEMPAPQGIGDSALVDVGVLVAVRGDVWDGDGAAAKAQEIFNVLHGLRATVVGSTTYLGVRALTAAPVFIGFDERGRPQHTIAFRLLAEHPAAGV